MRGVRRHTESIYIVLLTEPLKNLRFVTLVVIHNQQALLAYEPTIRILDKVP